MTVLEFLTFAPSEAYKSAPDGQFKEASSVLSKVEGIESAQLYHGIRIEDDSLAQIIMAWSSVDAHKAFMTTPGYKDSLKILTQAFDESRAKETVAHHAVFDEPFSSLKPRLTAPITEFALMKHDTKEGIEDGKAKVKALAASVESSGFHGLSVGTIVEVENKLLLIGGWDSIEAHGEAAQKDAFKECAAALIATGVTVELAHIKMYASPDVLASL